MQQPDLKGKTALVTGGGRGIGRAAALELGRCGADVVVTARSLPEIESAAGEIRSLGAASRALRCDVSHPEEVHALFEEAGPVDILVNNAGIIGPIAPAARIRPEEWLENIAVNLNAVFYTCRYALPGMIERRWGKIVNVSSGAARGRTAGWSAYGASKAGVEAFTSVTALEVADSGVRVNAVRPGIVDTAMQAEIRRSSEADFGRENVERFRRYKAEGMLRKPEDAARLILWLLSPEADEVNGEVLAIDDPEVAARIGLVPMGR